MKLKGNTFLTVLILILAACAFVSIAESDGSIFFFLIDSEMHTPPANEIVRHMNKRYGVSFYLADTGSEEFGKFADHTGAFRWSDSCNGVVVCTDDYPGHYFYARKSGGEFYDDYGCHLAEAEAAEILLRELEGVIDKDIKAACHPYYEQDGYPADITAEDYLKNCGYILRVYVRGDGNNADRESDAVRKRVYEMYSEGKLHSDALYVACCEDGVFDRIAITDPCTYPDGEDCLYEGRGSSWNGGAMGWAVNVKDGEPYYRQ